MRKLVAAALLIAASAPAAHATSDGVEPVVHAFTRGSGYATGLAWGDSELIVPNLVVPQGATLIFNNLHVWGHSMYSQRWAVPGELRLFNSEVIPFRHASEVRGVDALAPGVYEFFCSNHIGMQGKLTVI